MTTSILMSIKDDRGKGEKEESLINVTTPRPFHKGGLSLSFDSYACMGSPWQPISKLKTGIFLEGLSTF